MPTEIISVREAARRLGRGTATIEQALKAGTFPIGTLWWLPVAVMVIGTGGLFAFMFATI